MGVGGFKEVGSEREKKYLFDLAVGDVVPPIPTHYPPENVQYLPHTHTYGQLWVLFTLLSVQFKDGLEQLQDFVAGKGHTFDVLPTAEGLRHGLWFTEQGEDGRHAVENGDDSSAEFEHLVCRPVNTLVE